MTEPMQPEVAEHLCLVLDTDDLVEALRWAEQLRPWFGSAKVGLELFSAAGPEAVGALREVGYDVFLDLKLHDIPTTVARSSRVLGALGVRFLTMHARGGDDMLRAGVEAFREGASQAGLTDPVALAVTVLTSDDSAPRHIVPDRVSTAREAGCGGLVLAAADLPIAADLAPNLLRVVPGIRMGGPVHDQARASTPEDALRAGADLLVVGRAVTGADDPQAAAAELTQRAATALADR